MLLYECLYFKKLEVLKVFLDLIINVFTVIFNQFNVYLLNESINSFYWKFFEGYSWCMLALFSVGKFCKTYTLFPQNASILFSFQFFPSNSTCNTGGMKLRLTGGFVCGGWAVSSSWHGGKRGRRHFEVLIALDLIGDLDVTAKGWRLVGFIEWWWGSGLRLRLWLGLRLDWYPGDHNRRSPLTLRIKKCNERWLVIGQWGEVLILMLQIFIAVCKLQHLRGLIEDLVLQLRELQRIVPLADDFMQQLHV